MEICYRSNKKLIQSPHSDQSSDNLDTGVDITVLEIVLS